MASKTIQAAGGIVVRKGARPLVAVVQRSKDDAWVLPRGKLKRDENPIAGARREVVEETGHRVRVGEFLGAITYRAQGRPKVVQFWLMQAEAKASHDVMADIVAVEWLPLKAAVRRLSYPLEKLFLRNIASRALPRRKRRIRGKGAKSAHTATRKPTHKRMRKKKLKTKKRKPAQTRTRKTTSRGVTAKTRTGKPGAVRKSTPRKTAVAKLTAARASATKHVPTKPTAHIHTTPQRTVPKAVVPAAPEHVVTSITAAKSATAAERKTILQRMLGRLAG